MNHVANDMINVSVVTVSVRHATDLPSDSQNVSSSGVHFSNQVAIFSSLIGGSLPLDRFHQRRLLFVHDPLDHAVHPIQTHR